jgi:hypothetical protein
MIDFSFLLMDCFGPRNDALLLILAHADRWFTSLRGTKQSLTEKIITQRL